MSLNVFIAQFPFFVEDKNIEFYKVFYKLF